MRKFVLTAVLLISAAQLPAHAGPSRGLTMMASADTAPAAPAAAPAARVSVAEQLKDETPAAVQPKDAAKPQPAAEAPAADTRAVPRPALKVEAAEQPAKARPAPAKPVKRVRRETDEQKARRIAARYGVFW